MKAEGGRVGKETEARETSCVLFFLCVPSEGSHSSIQSFILLILLFPTSPFLQSREAPSHRMDISIKPPQTSSYSTYLLIQDRTVQPRPIDQRATAFPRNPATISSSVPSKIQYKNNPPKADPARNNSTQSVPHQVPGQREDDRVGFTFCPSYFLRQ